MLLQITNKCYGECTHCLQNSTKDGKHMSDDVLEQSIKLIRKINPKVLLITGGEPPEHPRFFEIVEILSSIVDKKFIVVPTNGMFLYNEDFTNKVLDLGVNIQVTNDERYYPHKINMSISHPNLVYETRIQSLYPQGRAKDNGFQPINCKAPKCFNLRSLARNNASSLSEAIHLLEKHNKFCTPIIDFEGNIHPGESRLCGKIGNVFMDHNEIFSNLRNFKCNNCGMKNNLESIHLKAIGEL